MISGVVIVSCALLAQSADGGADKKSERSNSKAAENSDSKKKSLVDAKKKAREEVAAKALARRKKLASALAESLFTPAEEKPSGDSLPLRTVLARFAHRDQQQRAVGAYWTAAAALAEHNIATDEAKRLAESRKSAPAGASPRLNAALAAAEARLKEAAVDLSDAQLDLAMESGQPEEKAFPLDLPLVTSYKTGISRYAAYRAMPAWAYQTARALPLRFDAILSHAAAVQAAEELLNSDLSESELIGAIAHHSERQKAFVRAVKSYNVEIAHYALFVAQPGESPDRLVDLLIAKPKMARSRASEGSRTAIDDPDVHVADHEEPLDEDNAEEADDESGERTVRKPVISNEALYADLAGLKPKLLTRKLSQAMHAVDDAPESLTLSALLEKVSMYDRGRAVRAYWAAAEKRAWVHTLEQEAARLQAQAPQLSAMREKPGGPEAGLRWNSQRRTVEAELDDANREYQAAQFTLAELLGQPASETGPLPSPSDAPYAGTYDFKSDSLSEDKRQSPTVTRHAEAITRWAPVMRERAESVVAADAAFADAAKAAELDPADMETLLDSLVRQRRESRAFLRDVRHYAGLIADYSLAVLPRGAQSSRLATALGVGAPASGP